MKDELSLLSQGNVYDRMSDPLLAITTLGEAIAKSGMFGCDKVEQGTILALQCISERKAPLEMAKTYHIIGGKLSMRSDAMLASYRARGGKVIWRSFDEKLAKALWKYDGNEIELSYSIEEAKAAGLIKEKSGWIKDPAAMLRARLISKAIRMLAPEVCTGMYVPEEMEHKMESEPHTMEIVEDKLETLLSEYEPKVTELFLAQNWITEGQNYLNVDEERRNNILKNPKPLLERLRGEK